MNTSPPTAAQPKSWKQVIAETRATWLSATLVGGALALIFGLATARYWEATQAVVVRQDATASHDRPGKFADLYEMRTVQETILELARSRQVVSATLAAVDGVDPVALTADDLDKFRSHMEMTPPGGAEFGKTEVFYLNVQDSDRSRALQLVAKLCEQLDLRLRELRAQQARGMIAEIDGQLTAAEDSLATETNRLAQFETSVGADLGELRMLHSAWSGQSDLRQRYVNLGDEFRRAQEQVQEIERLLQLLEATEDDPHQLASLPNSLLAAQPALSRLKEGLVDAQLRTSRLQGARAAEHPRVVAAIEAEASMRRDLVQEILAARHSAEAELQLRRSRQTAAERRLRQMEKRLADLAEQRAEYSNLVAASESSRASVDELRGRLATAQALLAAAENSSVLNLVDSPETGPSPTGPSRATMLLAGLLAGLTVGAGLVFYQQAPEVAYVATPAQVEPPLASRPSAASAGASEIETPTVQEWWETPTTSAFATTARHESPATFPSQSPPEPAPGRAVDEQATTPPPIHDEEPTPRYAAAPQAVAVDNAPPEPDSVVSEPELPVEATESELAGVAPLCDQDEVCEGDDGDEEQPIAAESAVDEPLAVAEELAIADEPEAETAEEDLPLAAETSTAGDEGDAEDDEVARQEPATEQEPLSSDEGVDDGLVAEEASLDEEVSRAPECVSSSVEDGLASLGIGSTDLKDAMRDAFLPTQ